MNDAPIIEVRDLRKTYRVGDVDVHALQGVDLTVRRGEFVTVVGPSGSGKSTLFHILGGLTPATSGQVVIDGRDLSKISDAERTAMRKRLVGFVFQKYNLLPTLSAADNIAIARHIAGADGTPEDPKFREVLGLLGIEHRLHHKPRALSGGEQQRVAIARAIVNHPAILLADEPTGNLDSVTADAIYRLFEDLHLSGLTLIVVTHNTELAKRAGRVITIRDGCIC